MKKQLKLLVACFALFACVFVVNMPVSAASGGVIMDSCTDTSFTISYPAQATYKNGNSNYRLCGYELRDSSDNVLDYIVGTSTTMTITGQSKGVTGSVWLYACYTNYGYSYVGYCYANTKPANVSGVSFGGTSTSITVGATRPSGSSGIQLEKYNLKEKTSAKKNFYSSTSVATQKNTPYRFRVRAYYENPDTGKKYYGSWTGWKYCEYPYVTLQTNSAYRGIYVTLRKCAYVDHFNVYVSKSRDSGYKLTKTVKFSTSSTKVRLTTMGSTAMTKGTYYYVKVVPVFKISGKNITSKTWVYGGMTNPR